MKKMGQTEFNNLTRQKDGYIYIDDNTDCTEIIFQNVGFVKFGNGCKFGNECEFGHGCKFGNECEFGDWCKFGNECEFGNWCEFGHGCEFGNWCEFGHGCEFGNGCKFGNGCEFGHGCEFGNGCKFGNGCEFDYGCNFENNKVIDGTFITIGGIGSENRKSYFFIDKTGNCFVRCGCFFGTEKEFIEKVKETHENTIHAQIYLKSIAYAKEILDLKKGK